MCKKFTQFKVVLHFLSQGNPMLEYKGLKELLLAKLETPNTKHWCDNSSQGIIEAICGVIEKKTKDTLDVANFISITTNKVTTIDNQSWLCCHAYTVQKWRRVPFFLGMVHVVDDSGADKLTTVIHELVMQKGGMSEATMEEKLICFGANGHTSFSRDALMELLRNFSRAILLTL